MKLRTCISLACVTAVALALTACGDVFGSNQTGPTAVVTVSPKRNAETPTRTPTPTPTPTFDEALLRSNVHDAIAAVNMYWADHWQEWFDNEYQPPAVWGADNGFYVNADDGPTCNGEPAEEDNAFYCTTGDYVAWSEELMERADPKAHAWPFLIVAHEWGHAIQHQEESIVVNGDELQADCFAAAALYGAADDGLMTFERSDEKVLATALAALADDTAWTSSEDHGSALERIKWFTKGKDGGVTACFPTGYERTPTPTTDEDY